MSKVSQQKDSQLGGEAHYASLVVTWLTDLGYEVYQEVNLGCRPDIVAVLPNPQRVWVIEVKQSLSLSVLEQAYRWLHEAHYVSVATPYVRRRSGYWAAERFMKSEGIGYLQVNTTLYTETADLDRYHVDEQIRPCLNRKAHARLILDKLCEEQKTYAVAGNNQGKYWSPFKRTCREIERVVKANPGIMLKELIAGIEHHYASTSTAKSSISVWAQAGKIPNIKTEREGNKLRFYHEEK